MGSRREYRLGDDMFIDLGALSLALLLAASWDTCRQRRQRKRGEKIDGNDPGWCWEGEQKKWWNRGEKGSRGITLFAGSVITTTCLSGPYWLQACFRFHSLQQPVFVLWPCVDPGFHPRVHTACCWLVLVPLEGFAWTQESVSDLCECWADDIVKEGSCTNGLSTYIIIPNRLFNGYIWTIYMQLQWQQDRNVVLCMFVGLTHIFSVSPAVVLQNIVGVLVVDSHLPVLELIVLVGRSLRKDREKTEKNTWPHFYSCHFSSQEMISQMICLCSWNKIALPDGNEIQEENVSLLF